MEISLVYLTYRVEYFSEQGILSELAGAHETGTEGRDGKG